MIILLEADHEEPLTKMYQIPTIVDPQHRPMSAVGIKGSIGGGTSWLMLLESRIFFYQVTKPAVHFLIISVDTNLKKFQG